MTPYEATLPKLPPSLASRLLGGLVVWQLVFIPLSSVLEFFPHRELSRDEITDFREQPRECLQPRPIAAPLAAMTDCWAQMTGQYQMWWLFAPDFPSQATFPTVELRWRDRPSVKLLSLFEPEDPHCYCRLPGSNDRLFQYEVHLGLGLVYWNAETAKIEPDAWREAYRAIVARQWKSMRAYMRWRLEQYQLEHPDQPTPSEVVLSIRIYPTPDARQPEAQKLRVVDQPLARWQPDQHTSAAYLPLEAYDPFARQFVLLEQRNGLGPKDSRLVVSAAETGADDE